MVQPIDYRINVAQPMAGALSGVQNALQLAQGMETADAEKARGELYKAQTAGALLENESKVRAAEQAKVLQADLNAVVAAPTTDGINKLMLKYPHLSESFNRGLGALNAEEQKARIQEGTQVYAAILNGQPELGAQILKDTAGALREKGNRQQAETYERMAKLIELNPDGAQTTVGMMLATAMGPDKFQSTFKELEDQRRTRVTEKDVARRATAEADKAKSEAEVAAVKARFAESDAVLEAQQKGWNVAKLQADTELARANMRLANMRAQLEKEMAPLQKKELEAKIQQAERDRDQKTRERLAEATGQYQIVNEAESLITDILDPANRPALKGATGISAWIAAIPGTPEKTLANKIERLSTLLTVDNLKLMSGVLTDKDIAVLRQVGGNFDRYMASGAVIKELERANNALSTARGKLEQKYGPEPKLPGAGKTETDW